MFSQFLANAFNRVQIRQCLADASWMFTTTATHSSVSYSNDLELCSPSSPVLSQPSRNPVDRSSDNTASGRLGVRGLLPFATLNLPPVEPTHRWLECQSCGKWADLNLNRNWICTVEL